MIRRPPRSTLTADRRQRQICIRDSLEAHPDAVKAFVKEYANSVAFTNAQPADAAKLIAKYEIAAEEIAKNAIPRCNIVWLHGENYKAKLENFLGVVYKANPAGIGGKMPGDDFYQSY